MDAIEDDTVHKFVMSIRPSYRVVSEALFDVMRFHMFKRVAVVYNGKNLTLSHQELIIERCCVVLTFESIERILRCGLSNETSLAVLLHGTIGFVFYRMRVRMKC